MPFARRPLLIAFCVLAVIGFPFLLGLDDEDDVLFAFLLLGARPSLTVPS